MFATAIFSCSRKVERSDYEQFQILFVLYRKFLNAIDTKLDAGLSSFLQHFNDRKQYFIYIYYNIIYIFRIKNREI